ncbi:MAG: ABC transporter ATP-binding protein [Peptococcaceae bacterium]|nr:ABC transporter ATP-binding protein [Peptococcaceae bacterium]
MANVYDLDEQKEAQTREFNKDHFSRMLGYLRPYSLKATLVCLLMIAVTAGNLAEPILIKVIVDKAIAEKNLGAINNLIAIFLALRLAIWVFARYQAQILNWTGQHVLYDLRQNLFAHIQNLSFDFYDGRPVGKIMARVTSDVNTMSQFINNGVVTIITQVLNLVGIVVILLSMHWKLSLFCIGLLPFLGYFMARVHPFFASGWAAVREESSKVNAHLNESITGIQVIQAFSRQETNTKKFEGILENKVKAWLKVIRVEILFWPVIENVGALGMCLVIWYGAREYMAGALTVGTLWAFINYLNRFWQPLSAISRVYSQMLSSMAGAERVFGFLDTEPRVQDSSDAVDIPEIMGAISFKDVSFGYQEGQQVLKNITFDVAPGQTVALVGATGAGKSTIINLVARFYDPTSGAVYVDGYDLKATTLQSFRSQLGVVLQDPFIFAGTILENIEYGRLGATIEEVMAAAKAVNAHTFIEKLSNGYDTETEERGGTLSQGQRQLLAFTRALVADPRILILDEATSSIDTETEQLIQKALGELLKGRTSFVIAHRLSTIRNADVIMVVDDGRIIERGSHDELIAHQGKYYALYTTQYKHMRDMLRAD